MSGLGGLFLSLVICNFVIEAIKLALQTGGKVSMAPKMPLQTV